MTRRKNPHGRAKAPRRGRLTSAARRLFHESGIFCRIYDYPRALRTIRQALRHAPDNVMLLREEAWYLQRLGYKASALQAHKRISRLLPRKDGSADLEACGIALALNRKEEARRLLARALKRNPALIGDAQDDERISQVLKRIDRRRSRKSRETTKKAKRRRPEATDGKRRGR